MNETVRNTFRLQPHEVGLVLLFGFLLLGNSLAQQVAEITAVSNFLDSAGVNGILVVWMLDSIVIFAMMGVQSLIIDKYNRARLTQAILLILIGAFLVLRVLFLIHAPKWLNYGLLFLVSEQQWLLFPIIIWTLANDVFNMAEAKRLFPIIGSGDFLGKLIGIGIAASAPVFLQSLTGLHLEDLLLLNALIYLLAYLFLTLSIKKLVLRPTSQLKQGIKDTLSEGWNFIKDVPVFRYLALLILSLLIVDTIIEFRFLSITDEIFINNPASFQVFYSFYRLGVVIISLILQALVTSRIVSNVPLKNLFIVEPLALAISSLFSLLMANLAGALGSISFLKIPQLTLGDSIRKAFQSLVPEERRGRVSIFMDSYLFSAGTLAGCILTGLIILLGALTGWKAYLIYCSVALVFCALAIWASLKVRKVYDESMLNWRLKRRQRNKSVLERLEF
jgi:ATP:ADP antiporter, AAA family